MSGAYEKAKAVCERVIAFQDEGLRNWAEGRCTASVLTVDHRIPRRARRHASRMTMYSWPLARTCSLGLAYLFEILRPFQKRGGQCRQCQTRGIFQERREYRSKPVPRISARPGLPRREGEISRRDAHGRRARRFDLIRISDSLNGGRGLLGIS